MTPSWPTPASVFWAPIKPTAIHFNYMRHTFWSSSCVFAYPRYNGTSRLASRSLRLLSTPPLGSCVWRTSPRRVSPWLMEAINLRLRPSPLLPALFDVPAPCLIGVTVPITSTKIVPVNQEASKHQRSRHRETFRAPFISILGQYIRTHCEDIR